MWRKYLLRLSIIGPIQFVILTALAMWFYPGGTIHHPEWEQYSFTYNYFSDLGRTSTFDQSPNIISHYLFKLTLSIVGLSTIGFFIVLPTIFNNNFARILAIIAAFLGVLAGGAYIAIGHIPWNESYWGTSFFCNERIYSIFRNEYFLCFCNFGRSQLSQKICYCPWFIFFVGIYSNLHYA